MKQLLQEAIRNHNRDDLLARCLEVGIPAGAVRKMNEVFDEAPDYLQLPGPNGAARGVQETAIWPPAAPERLDDLTHPPAYAANTSTVLREVLGKSDAEIDALLSEGAVEQL